MKVEEFIKNYIKDVTSMLEVSPDVSVENSEEGYSVVIDGDDLNFLIGFRGSSLYGLQHLLGLALYQEFGEWQEVLVDINGYQDSKRERLEDLTKGYIDRVRFFSDEVSLPSMPAYDRKLIHEFISLYEDIESFSVGEGYERHVVLKPVN